jgi:hypothetical protein
MFHDIFINCTSCRFRFHFTAGFIIEINRFFPDPLVSNFKSYLVFKNISFAFINNKKCIYCVFKVK